MFTSSCNLREECHLYLWLRDKHTQLCFSLCFSHRPTHTKIYTHWSTCCFALWHSDSGRCSASAAGESSVSLKIVSFSINLCARLFKVSWKQIISIFFSHTPQSCLKFVPHSVFPTKLTLSSLLYSEQWPESLDTSESSSFSAITDRCNLVEISQWLPPANTANCVCLLSKGRRR